MDRIGLIAGSGNFPFIFAEEARKKGAQVIAFAIKGVTNPGFDKAVDRIHWIDVNHFNIPVFIALLLTERIKKIAMAGKIDKALIFSRFNKVKDIQEVLSITKDNTDYSILDDVTKRFNKIGVDVIDGLEYLGELLPQKGVLSKRQPAEEEKKDIEFGLKIAREIAKLDVGQTITVHNRAVITVEALEGTDNTIRRAKDLVKGPFTVVKVARPDQDMRWDVPMVGADTINAMVESGATALSMESGKMFFTEKNAALKIADENNISIVVI